MLHSLKNKTWLHYVALLGLLGVVFYLLHDVIGALYYPGYHFMSQAVSDLTAVDAPSRIVAGGLSNVYGTLSILSSFAVMVLIQKKLNSPLRLGIYIFALMNVWSHIGYSLFPLSSSGYDGQFIDFMHVYVVTTTVVLLSILSMVLIMMGGYKKSNEYRSLAIIASITLLFMFSGAILSNIIDPYYFGLVERFSTYSAVCFSGILGIYGFHFFDAIEKKHLKTLS